ncbi:MAG: hypothetical protein WC763_00970 [Candidatus Paceibacterota bacterium]|jgi:hypothetical protein
MKYDTNVTSTAIGGNMRVVLNNGSDALASATLPVRWFLSESILATKNKHLLIITQTKEQFDSDDYARLGERKIVKISDQATFIQFFSPGKHVMTIIPLYLQDPKAAKAWMRKEDGLYEDYCSFKCAEGVDLWIGQVIIPEGFFAEKPKGVIGRWAWNFTVSAFGQKPRDQCAYRGSLILALALCAITMTAKLFFAVLATIILPIGRMVWFFAGWRPVAPWSGILAFWKPLPWNEIPGEWNMRQEKEYRVWTYDRPSRFPDMPLAPWEVCVAAGIGYLVLDGIREIIKGPRADIPTSGLVAVTIICSALMVIMLKVCVIDRSRWYREWVNRRWDVAFEKREAKRKAPAPVPHTQYSSEVFLCTALDPERANKTPITFRTVGWMAKNAVCKPFAR